MPTAKPRITITLDQHSHEVLSRLSVLSGDSMSQIVTGFVDLAVPSLVRVVAIMERAKAAPEEARAGLAAAIERADRDLIPRLVEAAGQGDMFLAQMQADLSAPRAERRQAPARGAGGLPASGGKRKGSTPVPVTRGSGAPKRAQPGGVKGGRRG